MGVRKGTKGTKSWGSSREYRLSSPASNSHSCEKRDRGGGACRKLRISRNQGKSQRNLSGEGVGREDSSGTGRVVRGLEVLHIANGLVKGGEQL